MPSAGIKELDCIPDQAEERRARATDAAEKQRVCAIFPRTGQALYPGRPAGRPGFVDRSTLSGPERNRRDDFRGIPEADHAEKDQDRIGKAPA